MKNSIVLIHGCFEESFYKKLKNKNVYILESRPNFESAQFSVDQLNEHKNVPTLICDNMAGSLFYQGLVGKVYLAYQSKERGGVFTQVGGLILAVLGKTHKIDVETFSASKDFAFLGKEKDMLKFNGRKVAPEGTQAYVPLVDWIPQKYLTKVHLVK